MKADNLLMRALLKLATKMQKEVKQKKTQEEVDAEWESFKMNLASAIKPEGECIYVKSRVNEKAKR